MPRQDVKALKSAFLRKFICVSSKCNDGERRLKLLPSCSATRLLWSIIGRFLDGRRSVSNHPSLNYWCCRSTEAARQADADAERDDRRGDGSHHRRYHCDGCLTDSALACGGATQVPDGGSREADESRPYTKGAAISRGMQSARGWEASQQPVQEARHQRWSERERREESGHHSAADHRFVSARYAFMLRLEFPVNVEFGMRNW